MVWLLNSGSKRNGLPFSSTISCCMAKQNASKISAAVTLNLDRLRNNSQSLVICSFFSRTCNRRITSFASFILVWGGAWLIHSEYISSFSILGKLSYKSVGINLGNLIPTMCMACVLVVVVTCMGCFFGWVVCFF